MKRRRSEYDLDAHSQLKLEKGCSGFRPSGITDVRWSVREGEDHLNEDFWSCLANTVTSRLNTKRSGTTMSYSILGPAGWIAKKKRYLIFQEYLRGRHRENGLEDRPVVTFMLRPLLLFRDEYQHNRQWRAFGLCDTPDRILPIVHPHSSAQPNRTAVKPSKGQSVSNPSTTTQKRRRTKRTFKIPVLKLSPAFWTSGFAIKFCTASRAAFPIFSAFR